MDTPNEFELSEFSMFEILYMGHEALTYVVEQTLSDSRDPFDLVAEIEERLGHALARPFK